jgi:predicted component of type VI protein secretion system
MPIKLQVTKSGADADEHADYLFEQERIHIGRGSENDLTLPDQKISSEHARLEREEGTYYLIDLESKNGTYLHGEALTPHSRYELTSGDVFQAGDYNLEFVPLFMPSSEQTAFAEEERDANPFVQNARQLADALDGLAETYQYQRPDKRDEELEEAFRGRVSVDVVEHEATERVLELIGVTPADGDGAASAGDRAPDDEVLDPLLVLLTQLIGVPRKFWREFTGRTVAQDEEEAFLRQAGPDELKAHLTDDDLSDEERRRRLNRLKQAAEALIHHQVAMLDGYRRSVKEGGRQLLEKVDPTDVADEGGGGLGGLFGSGDSNALKQIKERWETIYRSDWSEIEEEHFRPLFIEAYLNKMKPVWDQGEADPPTHKPGDTDAAGAGS